MIDVGIKPALLAGALAGARAQLGIVGALVSRRPHYGPGANGERLALDAFRKELTAKAKQVIALRDDRVLGVRLHMSGMAHELYVRDAEGGKKFAMMNRREAEPVIAPLRERFGDRVAVSTTPVFRFFSTYAPFLMK